MCASHRPDLESWRELAYVAVWFFRCRAAPVGTVGEGRSVGGHFGAGAVGDVPQRYRGGCVDGGWLEEEPGGSQADRCAGAVPDAGAAVVVQSVGRADRVSGSRPDVVHALSWSGL